MHEFVKGLANFEEYINWRCADSKNVTYQKEFIYSQDDELLVDFVGRFENLDADFAKICSRIGFSAVLPKLNVSNVQPYRQFYTNETRELVEQTYEPDIKTFNYSF